MRWQDISKILGTVGVVTLFSYLFLLTGMEYTHSGDSNCSLMNITIEGVTNEVYAGIAFINVTTKYWNIGFENLDTTQEIYLPLDLEDFTGKLTKYKVSDLNFTPTLYKKSTYGRKLWVNLNNVENIITTEPNVKIDWLVPARGKDNWRHVKEGDIWERGKNNRIKLVAYPDNRFSNIKWSFVVGEVDIDPIFFRTTLDYEVSDYDKNTKEIIVTNLDKDYILSDIADSEKKEPKDYLQISQTNHYGNGKISLMEKINLTIDNTTTYNCNCRDEEVVTPVNDSKIIISITKTVEVCDTCYDVKNYTIEKLVPINPETYTLKNNVPIYEVFEKDTSIEKLPNGKWGYSIYTEPSILGTKIEGATWWNSSWDYRSELNISNTNIDSTLSNFTVLVKLNSSRIDYAHTNDSGQDIRFTDSSDNTLSYEIEQWNESGDSFIWVKVPSISSSATTTIYIYYGTAGVVDGQDIVNTWDSNFRMVQHMTDTTTSTITDSTSSSNDGTKKAANQPQETSTAKIYKAQDFATDSRISVSDNAGIRPANITVSAWCKPDDYTASTNGAIIYGLAFGDTSTYAHKIDFHASNARMAISDGSNAYGESIGIGDNNWHKWTFTFDGSNVNCYKDTTAGANSPVAAAVSIDYGCSYPGFNMGSRPSTNINGYNGIMDEIRMSNVARTGAWVKAEYHSETDNLITFGTEESPNSTPPIVTISTSSTTTTDNTPSIIFTATDETSTTLDCTAYFNATTTTQNATTSNNTATTLTATTLTDGNYTNIYVNCTDDASNVGQSSSIWLLIDTTSPIVNFNNESGYTNDVTPTFSFNFTDVGSSTATCELFINDIGYGISDTWENYDSIISGLSDFGWYSAPTIFEYDSTLHLIFGNDEGIVTNFLGTYRGYNWTGSIWQLDTTIISGLTNVSSDAKPEVFNMSSTMYLISGMNNGTFNGYNWTGSAWQNDSAIISGLGDIGAYSSPTVFYEGSTWYLITGSGSGSFYGFNWTGSIWQSDSSVISGLNNPGTVSSPESFEYKSVRYLINGIENGEFDGYSWTGTGWQNHSSITNFLITRDGVAPAVFNISSIYYLMHGNFDGDFTGYKFFVISNNTESTITTNSSLSEGNCTVYINCTDESSNTGQSNEIWVYVDSTSPVVNLNNESGNITDRTPTFSFNYTDTISENVFCELFINDTGSGFYLEECYQETANVSTSCGGLDTGKYFITEHDGYTSIAYLYVNYTIPNNTNSSIWTVKHGNNTNIYNISIPNVCFKRDADTLMLRIASNILGDDYSQPQCYNGTSWNDIGKKYDIYISIYHGGGYHPEYLYDGNWDTGVYNGGYDWDNIIYGIPPNAIYEEGIYWVKETNVLNNTNSTITSNRTLASGNYTVYINCSDGINIPGKSKEIWIYVEKDDSAVLSLYLNGTEGYKYYEFGNTGNFTLITNVTENELIININGTNYTGGITDSYEKDYTFSDIFYQGINTTITGYVIESENYTSAEISYDARIYYINWTYETLESDNYLRPKVTYTTGTFTMDGQDLTTEGMNITYIEGINYPNSSRIRLNITFNQSLPACITRYTQTTGTLDISTANQYNTTSQEIALINETDTQDLWWWWVLNACTRGTILNNMFDITAILEDL